MKRIFISLQICTWGSIKGVDAKVIALYRIYISKGIFV